MNDGRQSLPEDVSASDTPQETQTVKPTLVTVEEFKERARLAKTPEERLALAAPFPLPTLRCEVMVAASQNLALYEKMFDSPEKMFSPTAQADPSKIDRAFIVQFVISCVVQPQLDEEALNLLIEVSPAEFSALAGFCAAVTAKDPMVRITDRMGMIATVEQQLLFDDVVGSMNTLTPA